MSTTGVNKNRGPKLPSERVMFRAMMERDREYDGTFYVAVRTTGIFCRPSCPARKPNQENVEFLATARDALFSGYRPCKRCRPLDTNGRPPKWVGRLLEMVEKSSDRRLSDQLIRRADIEPSRARRWFKDNYGMTFQAYQRARRLSAAMTYIREGGKVTEIAQKSGYGSESGFRDAFSKTFGHAPKKSDRANCLVATMVESPVGRLMLAADNDALCFLEFTDRRALEKQIESAKKRSGLLIVPGENNITRQAARELRQYFKGKRSEFDVPLNYPGTPFQMKVWAGLLEIPYGQTISYGELAQMIGNPKASRAVGTANGANRIAIIIPCHRVIASGGKLGGYGGGLWRKERLLELERTGTP